MVRVEVRPATRAALASRRSSPRETYDMVIDRLLEDTHALDRRTMRDLEDARRAFAAGDFKTQDQVERDVGGFPSEGPSNLRKRARPSAPQSRGRR